MKYENNIYKNLTKYFILTFFILSFIFILLYYFILTRVDTKNNELEFDTVNLKFVDLINRNNKFFEENKNEIANFIVNKDKNFVEKVYSFRKEQNINFSFIAYDNDYKIVNSISINNLVSMQTKQYMKILLTYFDDDNYYSYGDKPDNLKLIYIKKFKNGSLCMLIDCASLGDVLNKESKNYILTNKYNRVISKGSNVSLDFNANQLSAIGDDYIKYQNEIEDFKIYNVNKKFFSKDLLIFVLSILAIVSLIYITIIAIVTKKISKNISKSFNNLIDQISLVSNGSIEKLSIQSDDETSYISDNINTLIDNVKILEANNVSLKYEKKASEFKTMESQFNPHFLYNTLDVISYQMYIDKDECQKLISNLSKLLRYSINNMSFVYFEEDIEYMGLYIEIQKIKYKDNFSFEFSCDDSIKSSLVPKLFIQPILENSFKYGFTDENKIEIKVEIYEKDEFVFIDISDSGKILTRKQIEELNELINKKSENSFLTDNHHGLENTLKRLRILYKDSSLGFVYGDCVKVRISFKR